MSDSIKTYIFPDDISENTIYSKYYQIYTQLKKELYFGDYEEGARFFSLRELKSKYRADPRTIRAAIELLISDGFLVNKPSSGLYVNNKSKRDQFVAMGNIWFYQPGRASDHPYYYGMLTAIQKLASQYNLNVIINRGKTLESFKAWFRPESGDGLVITGEFDMSVIEYVRNSKNIRYVIVGNYELPDDVPNIYTNVRGAVKNAIDVARGDGYKKFAAILSSDKLLSVREFVSALEDADNDGIIEYIDGIFNMEEDGYSAMKQLQSKTFDALFVSEGAYPGLCRFLYESSVLCPDDLYVIQYGKNTAANNIHNFASLTMVSDKSKHAQKIFDQLFWGRALGSGIEIELVREKAGAKV